MRLTGQTPKPRWCDILRHTDERCPAWYAEREKESWIKYLDAEYGIDYETWCLVGQRHFDTNRNPKRKRGKLLRELPRLRVGLRFPWTFHLCGAVQLETPIESAIGAGGSATDSQHSQTPVAHQLYFAGLEPERYYMLESLGAVATAADQNTRQ